MGAKSLLLPIKLQELEILMLCKQKMHRIWKIMGCLVGGLDIISNEKIELKTCIV